MKGESCTSRAFSLNCITVARDDTSTFRASARHVDRRVGAFAMKYFLLHKLLRCHNKNSVELMLEQARSCLARKLFKCFAIYADNWKFAASSPLAILVSKKWCLKKWKRVLYRTVCRYATNKPSKRSHQKITFHLSYKVQWNYIHSCSKVLQRTSSLPCSKKR